MSKLTKAEASLNEKFTFKYVRTTMFVDDGRRQQTLFTACLNENLKKKTILKSSCTRINLESVGGSNQILI